YNYGMVFEWSAPQVPVVTFKVQANPVLASPIISISGVSVVYDHNPHPATGTASGVEQPTPTNLTSELHLFYSSDGGQSFSSSAPVSAGAYEIYYTFDGDNNYQAVSDRTDSGKTVT